MSSQPPKYHRGLYIAFAGIVLLALVSAIVLWSHGW